MGQRAEYTGARRYPKSVGGVAGPFLRPGRHHRMVTSFYEPLGDDRFASTPSTAGPWSPNAQHGGPPAALLGRALENLAEGTPRMVGRFTMDLLGPVPVAPLSVATTVLRPGRTVSLRHAELSDESGRVPARAQAWAFPLLEGPAPSDVPLSHAPADGHLE